MELDIVALCCDFTEYENMEEFVRDYDDEYKTIENIEERTLVIPIEGKEGFIVLQF